MVRIRSAIGIAGLEIEICVCIGLFQLSGLTGNRIPPTRGDNLSNDVRRYDISRKIVVDGQGFSGLKLVANLKDFAKRWPAHGIPP